jgi:hypothetical protein
MWILLAALDVGAGAALTGGVNWLDKPSDQFFVADDGTRVMDPSYPGFLGFTGGGGLTFEARFLRVLGAEIDLLVKHDQGRGEVTARDGQTLTLSIAHTALHVPILAKGFLPGTGLFGLLGVEPVLPMGSRASGQGFSIGAFADAYVMLAVGVGYELKVPGKTDLRLPLSVRFGWNPGTSDSVGDRARYSLNNAYQIVRGEYRSEFQYQLALFMGATLFF